MEAQHGCGWLAVWKWSDADRTAKHCLLEVLYLLEEPYRITCSGQSYPFFFSLCSEDSREENALQWRFRQVMSSNWFLSLVRGHLFHRRWEAVHVQPPGTIQFGDLLTGIFPIVPLMADHLTHSLPLLLLDMRLIILQRGTPSGQQHLLAFAVPHQVLVDTFPSAIGIYPQDRKWEQASGVLKRCQNQLTAAPHDRNTFCPACGNIAQGEGRQKGPFQSRACMSNQISFQKAGFGLVPLKR